MKLIDFLEVTNQNTDVVVLDLNHNEIAKYDGRDSIPERYNDREVKEIYIGKKRKCIYATINLLKV